MIRRLLWKEYREQRFPALVLVGLAILMLTAVLPIFEDGQVREEARVALALLFAAACGMVTGAILLANEQESGTQTLLDTQPRWRRDVWFAKFGFGVAMTIVQAALLLAASLPFFAREDLARQAAYLGAGLPLAGFFGLGCGLFGSAVGRSVLAAIGYAVIAGFGIWIAGWVVWELFTAIVKAIEPAKSEGVFAIGMMLFFFFALIALPSVLSALLYTRIDLSRRLSARIQPLRDRVEKVRGGWGFRSLLWLSARRSRVALLVFGVAALVAGQIVLLEPLLLWPAFTLLIGLIQGSMVFADEQAYGSFRFLADQRLPLGRVWLLRTSWRFGLALLFCLLMLLSAAFFMALSEELFDPIGRDAFRQVWDQRFEFDGFLLRSVGPWVYLTLWVVYGFSFGQVAGLLFRKIIVAMFLGAAAGLIAVVVWLPSLMAGGMPVWQLYAVPVVLLILTRWVIWHWATDRLLARRVLASAAAAAVFGLIWVGGAFAYRVLETPSAKPPVVVGQYLSSLPPVEDNPVRSLLMRAIHDGEILHRRQPVVADARAFDNFQFESRVENVVAMGWTQNDPDLAAEVDRRLTGDWRVLFNTAARHSDGMFEDPRLIPVIRPMPPAYGLVEMARVLAVQALRLQAAGQHREALNLLVEVLTVSRHVANKGLYEQFNIGAQMEIIACRVLAHWSRHPQLPTDELQRGLDEARRHEQRRPESSDNVRTQYVLARHFFEQPQYALPFAQVVREREEREGLRWRQALIMSTAVIPWERKRRERLLDVMFELMLDAQTTDYATLRRRARASEEIFLHEDGIFDVIQILPPARDPARDADRLRAAQLMMSDSLFRHIATPIGNFERLRFQAPTYVRGMQLQLALALFQHRHGRPAEKIQELVPQILPEIPTDPYAGMPFRYRLSKGEHLFWRTSTLAEERSGEWEDDRLGPGAMGGAVGDMGGEGMPAAGVQPPANAGAAPRSPDLPPRLPQSSTRRKIASGVGIIWSIGPDGVDHAGAVYSTHGHYSHRGAGEPGDVIFLAPRVEKKK